MDRRLKLALGALGALGVAAGVAAVTVAGTGAAAGERRGPAAGETTVSLASSPPPAASPGPAAGAQNARAARTLVIAAEAQVLGLRPRELTAELMRGTTLHQVADRKGVGPADFQARYSARLTALLDQEVEAGNLSAAQERQALQRLGTVPNWEQSAPAQP